MHYNGILETPIGWLGIVSSEDALVSVDWVDDPSQQSAQPNAVAKETILQLKFYFCDPGFSFDLPLAMQGTEHQNRVWQRLQTIPFGTTFYYGDLARELSSSPRAIGNACRRNPIPIIVPCHRIVARSGLGGYSGHTSGPVQGIKQWLLRHESAKATPIPKIQMPGLFAFTGS